MWELIGYCLYRSYPFQKAFMLLGDGANGKSTLLGALQEFLSRENVSAVELQALDANRFKKAKLEGKLANIAPDISDEGLDSTSTFKALTGGDLLDAERKYESPFEFENHATLIFSANQKPAAEDDTYAYKRRWIHFDFPHQFGGGECPECGDKCHLPRPQEGLLSTFRDEHAGILNLAAEAFGKLWERGRFQTATWDTEHGDEADDVAARPILRFVKNELIEEDGAMVRVTDAYDAYQAWANDHGHTVQGRRNHFEPAVVEEYAPESGKDPADKTFKVWRGLRLQKDTSGGKVTDYE
jgi:putative DNA primase/helicase